MNFTKTKKTAIIICISLAVMILPRAVFGVDPNLFANIDPEQCISHGNCSLCALFQLGLNVFGFLLGLLGAVVFAVFVYGGFTFFISARGNMEKVKTGKDMIVGGFFGILFVLIAWMMVNAVLYFFGPQQPSPTPFKLFNKDWNQINCEFIKPPQSPQPPQPPLPAGDTIPPVSAA